FLPECSLNQSEVSAHMVSRRSIRVKVMQLLYSLDRDPGVSQKEILLRYNQAVEMAYESLLFNLFLMIEITHQAIADRDTRHAKLRPEPDDLRWNAKLYENDLIQCLANNKSLRSYFDKRNFKSRIDQDLIQKMYNTFSRTPEYHQYVFGEVDPAGHREYLLDIYRELRKHDIYEEMVDDQYPFWQEDKSLVIGALKKIFKQLPDDREKFYEDYLPDKDTVEDFGLRLIQITMEQAPALEELIEPTLKNWDMERLAVLDVILIKMALVEFLYFPTIPTKVTLDEYVDISKEYSTPKSKDFVNGILDRLMKSLSEEGKIKKEGRGLLEE
ncbi:MAG TPA: transcription antitermination factor NusB, partial [Saprospiraceae bacterium]|nr:transcription antitermination factor NusB [Saprospiraceae bacterium]